ncbi:MAG TPA: hypothetical protein VGK67_30975 [Myxococcales bacterium]|jgi:hypothetical protein
MTIRVSVAGPVLALSLTACAGAFLPRSEPIDLGPDKARKVSISVEGPEDMPEWGEVLWGELVQALSTTRIAAVGEPGPGVLLIKATVESWDYDQRMEDLIDARRPAGGGPMRVGRIDHYRECTALMGATIEVSDPATGKVLAVRKYLGVDRGTQELVFDKFQAPAAFMRRAAGKVAAQFADDLVAGAKK